MPELSINFEESRHQESIIRSFLGCPGFLLGAIRYFSNQRHVIGCLNMLDDISIQGQIRDTRAMLELTANFDCLQWASDSVQSDVYPTVNIHKLSLLSEAYKTAVLLYGNRVLCAFKESAGATENEKLVLRLLDAISLLEVDAALFKCLLWPTFIAGLECRTDSEQELVVSSLKMLWDLTGCLNVINASKILHNYWERAHFEKSLGAEESQLYVIEQGWLLI